MQPAWWQPAAPELGPAAPPPLPPLHPALLQAWAGRAQLQPRRRPRERHGPPLQLAAPHRIDRLRIHRHASPHEPAAPPMAQPRQRVQACGASAGGGRRWVAWCQAATAVLPSSSDLCKSMNGSELPYCRLGGPSTRSAERPALAHLVGPERAGRRCVKNAAGPPRSRVAPAACGIPPGLLAAREAWPGRSGAPLWLVR